MMYIYGLQDPRNGEIRYIGATKNCEIRLRNHLCDTSNRHRANWINLLKRSGLKPNMIVIEEVSDSNWSDREIHWISYYKSIGCNLTNLTEGGEGMPNPSPEVREKLHLANVGANNPSYGKRGDKSPLFGRHRSEETKKKISIAGLLSIVHPTRGKKLPQEQVEQIRKRHLGAKRSALTRERIGLSKSGDKNANYGKPRSEETRAKISLSEKGKEVSEETRRKISMSKRGQGHPQTDETRMKIKASWALRKQKKINENSVSDPSFNLP